MSLCRHCTRTLHHHHLTLSRVSLSESRFTQIPMSQYITARTVQHIRHFTPSTTNQLRIDPEPPESSALRPSPSNEPPPDASTIRKISSRIRAQESMRAATEPYIAYGATQGLFQACALAGAYTMPLRPAGSPKQKTPAGEEIGIPVPSRENDDAWYTTLNLTPTFNTWAQLTFLHMWILTVRLRTFPPEHARHWHQNLTDHFFYAAEDRMATCHDVASSGTRNRYLKDLYLQWRGALTAYDEGFVKGDAVLAAAIWRNIFGCRAGIDAEHLALLVEWTRRSLQFVDRMDAEAISAGQITFPALGAGRALVQKESKDMSARID